MNDCGKKELLVAYLYNEVNATERKEFERHLSGCATCRDELPAFQGVREDLGAWQMSFVPPIEVVTPRTALDALRDFFRLVPGWFKVTSGLAATAAAALLLFALTGTRISFGQGGFDAQFGVKATAPIAATETPKPSVVNSLSRAEAEQMIQVAVAQAQAQAQQQTQLQLASLEAQLTATHQTQLQMATQRLRQEHQRRLQLELAKFDNGTRQTVTEWLLTATDNGQEASNEKNH
jgi:anti-sigma factor RsiW